MNRIEHCEFTNAIIFRFIDVLYYRMELALQVVGLKMTGKIEDAKNVAMRIVGGNGESQLVASRGGAGPVPGSHMASTSTAVRALRPRLFMRAGEDEDFEVVLLDFLSILDTTAPAVLTTEAAISHTTLGGQTMLHLATSLGFVELVRFLVTRGIDLNVPDRNGYTALHFAGLSRSKTCAQVLVAAGADLDISSILGVSPKDQAPAGFFDVVEDEDHTDAVSEVDSEESQWGDAEEDGEDEDTVNTDKTASRSFGRKFRSAKRVSVENEPASDAKVVPEPEVGEAPTEKQFAFFGALLQRTIAHLTAQKLVPINLPNLAVPAVSWDALPQIAAFPAAVTTPGWPSFLFDKRPQLENGELKGDDSTVVQPPPEWRATWDKWLDVLIAATLNRQAELETPPPVYTPRTADEIDAQTAGSPALSLSPPEPSTTVEDIPPPASGPPSRPLGWDQVPVSEQDVKAFAFQPTKQKRKAKKRMSFPTLINGIILILSLQLTKC